MYSMLLYIKAMPCLTAQAHTVFIRISTTLFSVPIYIYIAEAFHKIKCIKGLWTFKYRMISEKPLIYQIRNISMENIKRYIEQFCLCRRRCFFFFGVFPFFGVFHENKSKSKSNFSKMVDFFLLKYDIVLSSRKYQ